MAMEVIEQLLVGLRLGRPQAHRNLALFPLVAEFDRLPRYLLLDAAWASAGLHEAPLTREVARRSRTVNVPHQDPADRFLAATAEVYELTLVTDDANLLKGRGFSKLANR